MIGSIYKKYNDGLRKFLRRRLRSKEDVDDIAQDVYLRLVRHQNLEELTPSLALLKTIASNLLNDRLRRREVRKMNSHVSLNDFKIASSADSPEAITSSREEIDMVIHVFEIMDEKYQQAFVLNRLKGLTYDEIAITMNISKHTVKKYISRALLILREHFG